MCHYITNRCKTCHSILTFEPVNCGKGLAVLGLDDMTIECNVESREAVEENEVCVKGVEEREEPDEEGSTWERLGGWLRWGETMASMKDMEEFMGRNS